MAAEPMVKLIVAVAAALLIQQAGISAPAAIDDSNTPALKPPSRIDYLSFALHREGDSANGNALFHDQQRLACAKCHTTDGQAGKAGPDLFAVGDKFGRRELIESVLWPSASIAVGYSTTSIETRSGEELTGIIKQVTDDWVELVGADSSPVRISSKDILERRTSEISFMPEGLEASLTLAEFADLIEYLVSLKQPENTAIVEHGMPSVIPLLPKPVELEPFLAASLRFEHPVWFGPVPGETNVFLVAEHETGRVWRLEKESGGDRKTPFADLGQYQKGTRGLLGLVLHPHFDRNGRYFFARHLVENGKFSTWICERQAGPEKREDSGQATRVLLRLDEATNVHYGGGLQFGPDGFLYIGMGDSGPQEDPQGHSQNTLLWLGKMLRIDVDHRNAEQSYSVPSSNPFVSRNDIRPEIWAYGLREPWRFSFDALTGCRFD